MIAGKGAGSGDQGMVEKETSDKKEELPFADSSELFESILKEAKAEIQMEKKKVAAKPVLKPKPKPEAKPRPDAKPRAPTKLELEPVSEAKPEPEQKARPEAKLSIHPPLSKPGQDPNRSLATRTSGLGEEETFAARLSKRPLVRSRIEEQKTKERAGRKDQKVMSPRKEGMGLPVLRIILFFVLLAAGIGGASVYLGIIDMSGTMDWLETVKKEAPEPADRLALPPAQEPQGPVPKPETQLEPPQAASAPPPGPQAASTVQSAPEVQAKPALPPPAPPTVAKAETGAPPQPQVQIEPTPAPVQPPAVSTNAEGPQPDSQPEEVAAPRTAPPAAGSGVGYPYSVYLGSVQGMEYVKRAMSSYKSQGLSIYWSKVDLGAKGTWYRLFAGYFRNAQEAEAFIQQKRIKDGEVKETRYSNLLGMFETKQGGEERAFALVSLGLNAYWIPAAKGQVRVYSGAFITREGAEKNQAELNSKGVKSEIVER